MGGRRVRALLPEQLTHVVDRPVPSAFDATVVEARQGLVERAVVGDSSDVVLKLGIEVLQVVRRAIEGVTALLKIGLTALSGPVRDLLADRPDARPARIQHVGPQRLRVLIAGGLTQG
jgi:hypothetical protein